MLKYQPLDYAIEYPWPCNLRERDALERVNDFSEIEIGMTDEEAKQEANRCLRCDHFGLGVFKGGRTLRW